MQARFLLGPAGSGKTFRCLAEIRAALRENPEGPPLVLLAPKQSTFQLERQLLAEGSLSGYTRLQILSFERLAEFIVAEFPAAPLRLLDEEGRLMVLRALLTRRHQDLKIFHATARLPGFAKQLSGLLRELQRHQLLDRKLAALAARADLPAALRDKLHDFGVLLRAYLDWLTEHQLQDANQLLDVATETLRRFHTPQSGLRISALWLDGFAEMTPQELDFLAAVVPLCGRATLAFCLDGDATPLEKSSWLSPWAVIGRTFRKCHQRLSTLPGCEVVLETVPREAERGRFANSPMLAHLEKHWALPVPFTHHASRFTPPETPNPKHQTPGADIRVIECAEPENEAVFAAREILRHVHGGGRFRECAVLVRTLDNCHNEIRRVFQRYEIPFFLDRREPLAHHPLAELTRFALRTAALGWQHDDWFGALKTGLVTPDDAGVDELENEALARGWKGEFWRQPIQIPEDPGRAERCERLRRKIIPPLENLAAALGAAHFKPTGPQLAQAIRALWDDARVDETLESWSDVLAGVSAVHSTVHEQMNTWLDNVEMAFSVEALPMSLWLPILEAGLVNLSVGVIPPALDQVLVGAIDRSRSPDLKLALLLGMNEGVFPAPPTTSNLLTESDRETLDGRGVELGSGKLEQLGHERFYGYIACTRASERLVLTYARRDARDKALNPSPFITYLKRLFPGLVIESDDRPHFESCSSRREEAHSASDGKNQSLLTSSPTVQESAATATEMNADPSSANPFSISPGERAGVRADENTSCPWNTIEHANELAPLLVALQNTPHPIGWGGQRPGEGRAATELLQIPTLAALAESLRQLRQPSPTESLSPALATKLYGPIFKTSVSAIERFAACPFQFFVRSGLRADERQVFEVDARERGSFQHEVLQRFHNEVRAQGREWRDLSPGQARELIGRIAERVTEEYRQGLFRASPESMFAARSLTAALQDFMEIIIGWMPDYAFDPRAVELSFGFENDPLPAWEIKLTGGQRMAFRGKIDRVDFAAGETDAEVFFVVIDYKSSGKKIDPLLLEHGAQIQLPAYLAALRQVTTAAPQFFSGLRLVPVGAFYVNLRGDYSAGASRSEVLSDTAEPRRRAYRHTGRFSLEALPLLDRQSPAGHSGQFNYALTKTGQPNKRQKELMEPAEFAALLDHVEKLLRGMGDRIFAGEAAVDPYRKGSETPCAYCACQAICRIDPWRHEFRLLRASKEAGK